MPPLQLALQIWKSILTYLKNTKTHHNLSLTTGQQEGAKNLKNQEIAQRGVTSLLNSVTPMTTGWHIRGDMKRYFYPVDKAAVWFLLTPLPANCEASCFCPTSPHSVPAQTRALLEVLLAFSTGTDHIGKARLTENKNITGYLPVQI